MGRYLSAVSLLLAGLAVPAGAVAETPVDLELVLAVDVSLSIDVSEAGLQREGYVRAFRDPEVIRAIRSGILGRIAVAYVEWAGPYQRRVVIGWTLVDGDKTAGAFANALELSAPGSARRTSISGAIDYALPLFDGNGFEGTRRVIDVSGDGISNEGTEPRDWHPALRAAGITVNALAIEEDAVDLTGYFWENLILGDGAFVVTANRFEDYPARIRLKLLRETTKQVSCADPACRPARDDEG